MKVPEGWTVQPLGDFLQESRIPGNDGRSARKLTVRLYGKGVVAKEVGGQGSENTKYYLRKKGQFVYSKLDFLNGAFGVVPEELDGWETTLDLPAFDVSPTIDARWLLAYVTREQFYAAHKGLARGGRKARRVPPEELLQINVAVPPLREQRRVAEILSSVDEAIKATRAVIDQTRKVWQGVLDRLLTKGVGHIRFVETEIGAIPETWRLKTLGELCTLTNGNGFRPPDWTDHGLPIIRIQNLNGSREFNHFAGTPKPKWIVEPGDLLFSWAGVRGVSFGPYIWDGPRGVLNQHIFKVHPSPDVNKFWLYHAMRLVTARIEAKAHGFKASLLHVHKSEITGQLVAVPPESEQEEVVHRLNALAQSEQCSKDTLAQLEKTKSALLSDLLTGRKRVSADALSPAA